MLKKTIITLLTGTSLAGLFTYGLHLPKTIAQETQGILVTQSSSQIKVEDIKGFKGVIVTLGAAPDGKTLIVASNDGMVTAIDAENLESKYSQPLRANPYSNIAFSSDGKLFAVPSKQEVFLYDTDTGRTIRTLRGHSGNVSSVAMSPDNRMLVSVSGEDWSIKIWDVEKGTMMKELGEDIGPVTTVAFSPEGKFFVTGAIGNDRTIKFWDAETFELLNTSPQQPGFIYSLGITPDGKNLVAAVRNFVKVWDLNTNKEILNLKGPQLDLNKVAVSPDNRLVATANREGTVMIMDISQGKELGTLRGHEGWVQSVGFSPDGKTLYSGAEDKIVKVWDVSNF
jgi:WD40 repeat protein